MAQNQLKIILRKFVHYYRSVYLNGVIRVGVVGTSYTLAPRVYVSAKSNQIKCLGLYVLFWFENVVVEVGR